MTKQSENEINKVNELIRGIKSINSIMKTLNIPQEIIEKDIRPFGNACHIIIPKEYTNKRAKIIIKR